MKTSRKTSVLAGADAKQHDQLWQRISAARGDARTAERNADSARVEFKRARKTFKQAKKIAKEARKKLKGLKRTLKEAVATAKKTAEAKAARAVAAARAEKTKSKAAGKPTALAGRQHARPPVKKPATPPVSSIEPAKLKITVRRKPRPVVVAPEPPRHDVKPGPDLSALRSLVLPSDTATSPGFEVFGRTPADSPSLTRDLPEQN